MVINNKDFVDHDKIATPIKITMIYSLWISAHQWQRKPRFTKRRYKIIADYIQRKGYKQCNTVLRFLCSQDPHAKWLRQNRYTYFDNIFNDIKWERRFTRANKYFIKLNKQ